MNIARQLFRNTICGWCEIAILFAIAMVIPPLLLARLGKEGYGVWALVGQVISCLAILDLGVSNSVGRFVAKYNAEKDHMSLSRSASSAMFLFLVSSVLIILATMILWPNFSKVFHLSEQYFNTGKWLILLSGIGVALSLPLRIGVGMLQGIHRFDLIYLFRTSRALITLLLIVVFFGWLDCKSLLLLAVITIAATMMSNLFMCGIAYSKLADVVNLRCKYISLSNIREIWSLSFSALLITVATLFFRQGQIICVGRLVEPEAVTLYVIPIMLLTYGSRVVSSVVGALQPMASHMQALNEMRSLQRLNIVGVKISSTISFLIAVMAIVFGHSFFRVWLPAETLSIQDFAVLSNVLTIMVIGFAIGMPQTITDKMLTGIDKHWFVAVVSLVTSTVGLLVGVLLMVETTLGLYGMAIGWALVFLIRGVLVFPASACRQLGIDPLSYVRQAYLPPLAAAAILTVAAYLISQVLDAASIAALAFSIIFCLVVYAIAAYFLCLEQKHKAKIWQAIDRLRAELFRN